MADTVPAMLEPGEYVIKKSAAKKIGYKNLNKMNRGGKMPKAKYSSYKKGGKVKTKKGLKPGVYKTGKHKATSKEGKKILAEMPELYKSTSPIKWDIEKSGDPQNYLEECKCYPGGKQ